MERELAIYISAAGELDLECELVGQLLAEIPRSRRWHIRRTPHPFQPNNPDLVGLAASDFYLILMAGDIHAPIGVELDCARREHLPLFAYRKMSAIASPATAHFVHHAGIGWQPYNQADEFARHWERALIEQLVQGTPGYGLQVADLDDLLARLAALKQPAASHDPEQRRGAGRGGVILEG